jgi:hypothetical protein
MSRPACPALLSASYASPPVIAPSPVTETMYRRSPIRSRVVAIPSAAEMDVLACPAPKASCSLSLSRQKPEIPPCWRMVGSRSRRPVSILCT